MIRYVFALALSGGCALQPVPIYVVDERAETAWPESAAAETLIADACDQLELDCYTYPAHERGTVKLRLVDDAGPRLTGHTEGVDGCRRAVRAEPDADTIAHEFGHLFTLEHVEDEANLMYPSSSDRVEDPELEDEQIDDVHTEAALYVGGC